MSSLRPGRYRHYKGKEYELLGLARHSETEEALAVYRTAYGAFDLWVRPAAMFAETVVIAGVAQPRFAWLGPSTLQQLDPSRYRAARTFLKTAARPLEWQRFRYHFEDGSREEVLAELARFQNPDGGFAHGLEPDMQTPDSSALATSVAFQILAEVAAPVEHPLVQQGIGWLLRALDKESGTWRIIPPTASNAPHAFWWAQEGLAENFGHFRINPTAELAGVLYRWGARAPAPATLHDLTAHVIAQAEALPDPISLNDLHCLERLAAAPLPAELHRRLAARLERGVPAAVEQNPAAWGGYVLQPLAVAPEPQSPYAAALAGALQANLDFRIAEQRADGSWGPVWTWAALNAEAWARAERDWQGVITLLALLELEAWGRIAR